MRNQFSFELVDVAWSTKLDAKLDAQSQSDGSSRRTGLTQGTQVKLKRLDCAAYAATASAASVLAFAQFTHTSAQHTESLAEASLDASRT